ncbi:MAG TPA: hypothetical protein VGK04_10980 [Thermoanaerobaculia bacterium]|jgi:hypothetical protein
MRKAAVLALVAAWASSIVCAQTLALAPTTFEQPSLIKDLTIRADDSALVRAAKNAVANRMREAARASGVVINDAFLRNSTGRISQAIGPASPAPAVPASRNQSQNVEHSTLTPAAPNPYGMNRTAAQSQLPPGTEFQRSMQPATPQTPVDPNAPRASQNTTPIPNNDVRPNYRP